MKDGFIRRRVVPPVLELLKQGTTPEKISLSIAFGLTVGIFPALGWTTLLCFVAALLFRLNLPAVQLVNYFIYPLQLILLIPFIRAGEILFHSAQMALSASQMLALIKSHPMDAIKLLWVSTLHAVAAWALVAPLAIYVLYRLLCPALRHLARISGIRRSALAPSTVTKATAVIR